ncbi:hypothetical protein RB195_022925 [Necator americanus]|uniref:Uncharacterized protein n=1 Tax=Necator americanus TaxID=51031 RepID=A0ABR1EH50_NECAM
MPSRVPSTAFLSPPNIVFVICCKEIVIFKNAEKYSKHPLQASHTFPAAVSGLSSTTTSGKPLFPTSVRDKQRASIAAHLQTCVTPMQLDPASLKNARRRGSKAAKTQGWTVATNSLLKQAIANRLKPEIVADKDQLCRRISADSRESIAETMIELKRSGKRATSDLTSRQKTNEDELSNSPFLKSESGKTVLKARVFSDEMEEENIRTYMKFDQFIISGLTQSADNTREIQIPHTRVMFPTSDDENLRQHQNDTMNTSKPKNDLIQHKAQNRQNEAGGSRNDNEMEPTPSLKFVNICNLPEEHLRNISKYAGFTTPDRVPFIKDLSFDVLPTTTSVSQADLFLKSINLDAIAAAHSSTFSLQENVFTNAEDEGMRNFWPSKSPNTELTSHKSVTFSDRVQLHEIESSDFDVNENDTTKNEEDGRGSREVLCCGLKEEFTFDEGKQRCNERQEEDEQLCTREQKIKNLSNHSVQNVLYKTEDFSQSNKDPLNSRLRYSPCAFLEDYSTPRHGTTSLDQCLATSDRVVMYGLHDNQIVGPIKISNTHDPQCLAHFDNISGDKFLEQRHLVEGNQNHYEYVVVKTKALPEFRESIRTGPTFVTQAHGIKENNDQERAKEMRKQFLTCFRKHSRVPVAEEDPLDPIHTIGSLESVSSSDSRESVVSSVSIRKEAATHRNFIY